MVDMLGPINSANDLVTRDNAYARANHTGSQTASTISDFDTQVRTSTLNQMATPTASVAMGTQKLTGLAAGTGNGDSLRYEQVVGQYLLLSGGTMTGALTLGADLDVNSFALARSTRKLLDFTDTASAVNFLRVTNQATGAAPQLSADGSDTNIDLRLHPKGTGTVLVERATLANDAKIRVAHTANSGKAQLELVGKHSDGSDVKFSLFTLLTGAFNFGSITNHPVIFVHNNSEVIRTTGAGIRVIDGKNFVLQSTTGTKIGTATTEKLAFWNATPIVRPSSTGETTGFTAGSGTSVNDDSTFTGNVGSTAYRVSDIVKHLKNIGLIAP